MTEPINTQIDTQIPTPPPTPTPLPVVPTTKPSPLVPISLGISVLALGMAGFFGYQYFQVTKSQQPTKVTQTTESTTSTPTPTADPTANWKTYTNKLYSFKYPAEWNANMYAKNGALFGVNATEKSGDGGVEVIETSATPSKYVQSLEDDGVITVSSKTEKAIGANNGIFISRTGVIAGYNYVISSNNKIFDIHINSTKEEDLQLFNQILSTFKFNTASTTKESELKSLDSTWNQYTNTALGFTMKVPKTAIESWGSCKEVNGEFSSNPTTVPVVALAQKDGVYLTSQYFYNPTQSTKNDGSMVNTSCTKTTTTAALIESRIVKSSITTLPRFWHIIIQSVKNEQELDQVIKTTYGTGCSIGKQTLSQENTYDVEVVGDNLDMDKTQCPINFALALKYSPELHKIATWSIGQDSAFSSENNNSYDKTMIDSFVFTK